jgi:hypothetical protein
MKEPKPPRGTPLYKLAGRGLGEVSAYFLGKSRIVDFWRWYHPVRRVTFIRALIFATALAGLTCDSARAQLTTRLADAAGAPHRLQPQHHVHDRIAGQEAAKGGVTIFGFFKSTYCAGCW